MCLLWRVCASQYNIGLPRQGDGCKRGGSDARSLGAGSTVFLFFPPIRRVFFFMLLSEKLTNSETAVHNTTLITLHNAIIAVSAFMAARDAYITYITQYHYNYYFTGNCYRVFKITLQPVVGGVLSNILIIFIAAAAHLLLLPLCCCCAFVALRGSDIIIYTHTDIKLNYLTTTVLIAGIRVHR